MKTFSTAGILAFIVFVCISASPVNEKQVTATGTQLKKAVIEPPFGFFRGHRQGRDISLSWGMTDPSTVESFVVERSFDGEYFDPVCTMNCNNTANHSYRDTGVFGTIYYRITAIMIGGGGVYSPVIDVRVVVR